MTPGARVAAAATILDHIIGGAAAEQALTAWARASRFAGSKDRAAVRDHVFDVLRARRSLGDDNGRMMMARLLLRDGLSLDALFDGVGHAPAPLNDAERQAVSRPLALTVAAACDLPDWLWPDWQASLDAQAEATARVLQTRADVFLRVNQRRTSVEEAIAALAADGVGSVLHPRVAGCLRVTENPRRIKAAAAYLDGLVELQDASSQFAVGAVPVADGARVLDYCAGGGGKALALADMYGAAVFAHDVAPQRMKDLPARAARAQVDITLLDTSAVKSEAPFDMVFCDAPCSGSGTWRRTPDAKWRLKATQLAELGQMQNDVLRAAAPLVAPGGVLAYATCSVLRDENDGVIERFIAQHPEWQIILRHLLLPSTDGDGFFVCCLRRK